LFRALDYQVHRHRNPSSFVVDVLDQAQQRLALGRGVDRVGKDCRERGANRCRLRIARS
jgi:hypothetical protein